MWSNCYSYQKTYYFQECLKKKNIVRFFKNLDLIDNYSAKEKKLRIFDYINKTANFGFEIKKEHMRLSDHGAFCDLHGNVYSQRKDILFFSGKSRNFMNNLIYIRDYIYDIIRLEDVKVYVYDTFIKYVTKDYVFTELKTKLYEVNPFKTSVNQVKKVAIFDKNQFTKIFTKLNKDNIVRMTKNKKDSYVELAVTESLIQPCSGRNLGDCYDLESIYLNDDIEINIDISVNQIKRYLQSSDSNEYDEIKLEDTGKFYIINDSLLIKKRNPFFSI